MRHCWIVLALLLALPACQRFTKEGADREVYCLLDNRRPKVPEVQGTLDIEAKEKLADAIRERRTFELTLRDALELATVASREYRTQRENVYLTTLTLTRELNEFRPLWDVNGSVDSIAGICNEQGNVLAMMPHPERAAEALLGCEDGLALFSGAVESVAAARVSA